VRGAAGGRDSHRPEVDLIALAGSDVADRVPVDPAAGLPLIDSDGQLNGQCRLGQRRHVGDGHAGAQMMSEPGQQGIGKIQLGLGAAHSVARVGDLVAPHGGEVAYQAIQAKIEGLAIRVAEFGRNRGPVQGRGGSGVQLAEKPGDGVHRAVAVDVAVQPGLKIFEERHADCAGAGVLGDGSRKAAAGEVCLPSKIQFVCEYLQVRRGATRGITLKVPWGNR